MHFDRYNYMNPHMYAVMYAKLSFLMIICLFLVHPCDTEGNGGCSQICNKTRHKYECACEEGFVLGKDGKTCRKG